MTTNQHLTNSLASPPGTNDIRALKPPVAIPDGWLWFWLVLGGLLLAVAAFLAWRYWRKRAAQPVVVPVVPPQVRARARLMEALDLIGQPRPFCIAVSDTVRLYLEERFDFRAPERTTEEFLHELRATNLLTPDQKESLGEFLSVCDMVKFARYEPGPPELRTLHESAIRLLDETEPAPLASPAAGTTPAPA